MVTATTATAKKSSAASAKKPRSHPPYAEMITEAITSLKERTGSSQVAIAKSIEEKQKDLPPNFRKLLLVQLKKLVSSGKLTKIKGSFKVTPAVKPAATGAAAVAKPKKKPTTTGAAKTKAVKKPATATAKKPVVSKVKKTPVKKPSVAAAKVKKTPAKKIVKKPKSIKSTPAARKAKK